MQECKTAVRALLVFLDVFLPAWRCYTISVTLILTFDGERKLKIFEAEGTSDVVLQFESLDDIEVGTHWNHLPVSEDSNSCPEGALTASERANGTYNGRYLIQLPGEEFQPVTKGKDAATSDQKIYFQTIPCASSAVGVFVGMLQEQNRFGAEPSLQD